MLTEMQAKTYYKIIGNNFGHFNYKIGLNSLSDNNEEFNQYPEYGPGGLYFCDIKHIFEYLDYGDKVCTVEVPEDAQVVQVGNTFKADKIIITNIYSETHIIQLLLERGADIHAGNDYALRWASKNGHIEIVRVLLGNGANVHAKDNYALKWASVQNHPDVVRLLLENGADVHADDNAALRWSSKVGHVDIVRILLEYGAANDSNAIKWASIFGHDEVVGLLI